MRDKALDRFLFLQERMREERCSSKQAQEYFVLRDYYDDLTKSKEDLI